MKIRFWGVRGSIPAPLTPAQLKSKISSIVARARPEDLEAPEARERFLSSLPDSLFSTVGGNTSCVEVEAGRSGDLIILDAGTGLRELGQAIARHRKTDLTYHLFLSHLHWDHIQGLPFFTPLFYPDSTVHFYSPIPDFEARLKEQMKSPFFPVEFDVFRARTSFNVLGGPSLALDGVSVDYRPVNHPGSCYAYSFSSDGKKLIYATDAELVERDFLKTHRNTDFYSGTDALIIDAQYTLGEAIEKYNWGHSAFSIANDFASAWGIKKVFLFHHDPVSDDQKLMKMENAAALYAERLEGSPVAVTLAVEGMEAEI
jgi:phosphoribosyl 1,2-cyclic phosphodiesterase